MPALELTKCVEPGKNGNPWLRSTIAGLGFGSIWAFLMFVAGVGVAGIVLAGLAATFYAAMIAFCDFFFNARLVCISDEDILVGMVRHQEDSFDGDWTLNVLPAPFQPGATMNQMKGASAPQRRFFINQFPGHYSDFKGFWKRDGASKSPLIHNEIEGTKMQVWCAVTIAALGFAAFAGPIIVAACGPFAWLCALIIAVVVALVSWLGHKAGDTGSVTDVANDADAKAIKDESSQPVAIQGRSIFDPEHEGYNEIHAVRKIILVQQDDHDDFDENRAKEIQELLNEGDDPAVRDNASSKAYVYHEKIG